MESQGYDISDNVLEQDNQSALKLESNGRTSAGQKSRHINIRYFWVKDRLRSEKIRVRHCPTLEMLADFFTKPLQGGLFRKFRDVILGYQHIDTLATVSLAGPEERVEEKQAPSQKNSGKDKDTAPEPLVMPRRTWADVAKGNKALSSRSS